MEALSWIGFLLCTMLVSLFAMMIYSAGPDIVVSIELGTNLDSFFKCP